MCYGAEATESSAMEKSATSAGEVVPLVLIVDDHADSREMCTTLLELSGFRAAEAANGIEALSRSRDLAPACILMDLSLPGVDGWETARRLKADRETREIPIIALSGHVAPHDGPDGAAGEFAAVVTKPFTPESLLAAIRAALTGR